MPRTKCSVPLPLLLKEGSIISIIILSDFPTVLLLLTILLLGHLVQLAACKSRLLLSPGWCRVWQAGCSARSRFYANLQGQILLCWQSPVPAFRLTLVSEGDVESIVTWEKPWEAPAPKRLRVAGGSRRSQTPCSCQRDTDHIGCQPRQTWQLQQCVPGVSMGWRGSMAAKNLPPLAAGTFTCFTKCRCLVAAVAPSKAHLGQLSKGSAAVLCSLSVLTVTSRS